MLYILWLVGTQSTNEYLTFQDTERSIKNNCSFGDEHGQLSNQMYDESCLTCTILDNDQVPEINYQKSVTCIKLFFDHQLIFEKFFQNYRHIIKDLYRNNSNYVRNSTLSVHIKHYNLTEINFAYLNSIFNINSQPYNRLKIEFSAYTQELKPLVIVGNFSLMNISNLIITIPCNAYNQTIDYQIHSGKITSIKSAACEMSQSTKSIISTITNSKAYSLINSNVSRIMGITTFNSSSLKFGRNNTLSTSTTTTESTSILMIKVSLTTTMIVLYTSTNLTTSLSSQSNSSLLYLLFVFFIITICVIIASVWSFFRQNNIDNHHDIGNERLNTMHNMIHTDKYGVTDKDSKSAASWSHGSTLLLSPLVK